MTVLVFLLGLPLAVYTLAGCYALVDYSDKSRALVTLTIRVVLNLALLLFAGADCWPALLAAYAVVLMLHTAAFFGLRQAIRSGRWISGQIE